MLVDSAVYADGQRTASTTLEETYRISREPGKFAWVILHQPTQEEFVYAARKFAALRELEVEDAIRAHQRPKLEHYADCLLMVFKSAHYVDDAETIEFGQIQVFVGTDFILTVSQGQASILNNVRKQVEGEPDRLRRGPHAILYKIISEVVESYAPVVEGLEKDIDEIEAEVFGSNSEVSRRIHELSREIIMFHQATKPLVGALDRLTESTFTENFDPQTRRELHLAQSHLLRVTEQTEGFRQLLSSILSVNLTMVGVQQNNQAQKISAWAAILAVPTIIAGIFGMNLSIFLDLEPLRDLYWLDFWLSLLLMVVVSGILYWGFKRSGWL